MNKIVLDHYPTSKLPEDMRQGLDDVGEVRVTIEASPRAEQPPADVSVPAPGRFSKYRYLAKGRFSSADEVNDHVRSLRDEWDHREQ